MANFIENFKSKLKGGARSNLFRVIITYPSFVNGNAETASVLCKAASIPASNLGEIEINYRGRGFAIPGDRPKPEPWTITVLNDPEFVVRKDMLAWQDGINNRVTNTPDADPTQWYQDIRVEQLDGNEKVLSSHKLIAAWPKTVGEIELDNDNTNQLEEYPVEFEYIQWE